MAELLEPTGRTVAKTTYPWDEWLNGKPWRIHPQDDRGGDYPCEMVTMRSYLYTMARKRGLKVAITMEPGEVLVFQAYPPDEQRPELPSPWRRHANGTLDKAAPHKVPEGRERPGCVHCGSPLGTFARSRGDVCRSVLNMEWRCTDGTPKPKGRGPRG